MDFTDFGLLVLRLTFGGLTLAHGLMKLQGLSKFAESWQLSKPVATSVMLIQLIGGACIFLGLGTQIASALNAGVNLAILFFLITKTDDPFLAPAQHSWSIGVAYLGMALAVALLGAGQISVDYLLNLYQ